MKRSLQRLHARFAAVLPRIERHARCYFRWVKCWHNKEDKVQEVRSLTWKWIKKLHKRGKKWWDFVSRLADFACRRVRCGRKVAGSISIKDVMSEINQARKGYCVCKLPDFSTESTNPLVEALADHSQAEVADHVAFKIDFPAWLKTLSERDRLIVEDMAMGEKTIQLAMKYGVSEGRISQLRRQFHDAWTRFCDKSIGREHAVAFCC